MFFWNSNHASHNASNWLSHRLTNTCAIDTPTCNYELCVKYHPTVINIFPTTAVFSIAGNVIHTMCYTTTNTLITSRNAGRTLDICHHSWGTGSLRLLDELIFPGEESATLLKGLAENQKLYSSLQCPALKVYSKSIIRNYPEIREGKFKLHI